MVDDRPLVVSCISRCRSQAQDAVSLEGSINLFNSKEDLVLHAETTVFQSSFRFVLHLFDADCFFVLHSLESHLTKVHGAWFMHVFELLGFWVINLVVDLLHGI